VFRRAKRGATKHEEHANGQLLRFRVLQAKPGGLVGSALTRSSTFWLERAPVMNGERARVPAGLIRVEGLQVPKR